MTNDAKEQAKSVIAEIVRQSPGDQLTGKLRLFKAFYFSHLYYAKSNTDYLTEWPIVRMPNGPGIDRFNELLDELQREGILAEEDTRVGPFHAKQYTYTASKYVAMQQKETAAIREAVRFIEDKTGSQLSDITHEHSRSWNGSQDGEQLSIYLDLLNDEDYEASKQQADAAAAAMSEVWDAGS